jgi:hypothetical protein
MKNRFSQPLRSVGATGLDNSDEGHENRSIPGNRLLSHLDRLAGHPAYPGDNRPPVATVEHDIRN